MAKRKTPARRKKPLYVKNTKRKGNSSRLTRRGVTIALLLVVAAGILLGILAGIRWIDRKLYSENPRFEIQHLDISSNGKLTEKSIREWTGLTEGMNLFEKDFSEIEDALTGVALIESVYLERDLPNTLIIRVKERVPVARITGSNNKNTPYGVDRFGVILPPHPSASSLPLVRMAETDLRMGKPAEHPDMPHVLEIIAICEGSEALHTYVQIESLDVQHAHYIDIRLEGGTRVRMPRYSFRTKLQNLATAIKIAQEKGRRVKEVDLTLDSGKVPVTYY